MKSAISIYDKFEVYQDLSDQMFELLERSKNQPLKLIAYRTYSLLNLFAGQIMTPALFEVFRDDEWLSIQCKVQPVFPLWTDELIVAVRY
jgi:hypothetical protein